MVTWSESNRGLSLLGVLIALGLLGVGLLAVAQLFSAGRATAADARQTFVATNLAREGIELARAVRDNNWLTPTTGTVPAPEWINELCGSDPAYTNDTQHDLIIDRGAAGDIITAEVTDPVTDTQLYLDTIGRYSHVIGGEVSPYRRQITINCNKWDADPAVDAAFIEVTSHVSWEAHGNARQVTLKTKLYNWQAPDCDPFGYLIAEGDGPETLGAPDTLTNRPTTTGSNPAFITIELDPKTRLTNGPGDDLIVHVADFAQADEEFELEVSENGTTFTTVAVRPPSGVAGVSAEAFDIGGTGLLAVSHVKITNQNAAASGPEIDAIEVLNASCR